MPVRFEALHRKMFTFSLDLDIEIVIIRAAAVEVLSNFVTAKLPVGSGSPSPDAIKQRTEIVSVRDKLSRKEVLIELSVFLRTCLH